MRKQWILALSLLLLASSCLGSVAPSPTAKPLPGTNSVVNYLDFGQTETGDSNPFFFIQQTSSSQNYKVLYYAPNAAESYKAYEPKWAVTTVTIEPEVSQTTFVLDFTTLNPAWTYCELNTQGANSWVDPLHWSFEHTASGTIYFVCSPPNSPPRLFKTNLAGIFEEMSEGMAFNPSKAFVAGDLVLLISHDGTTWASFNHSDPDSSFVDHISEGTTQSEVPYHFWQCGNYIWAGTNWDHPTDTGLWRCEVGGATPLNCTGRQGFGLFWVSQMTPLLPTSPKQKCFMVGVTSFTGYLISLSDLVEIELEGITTEFPTNDLQAYIPATGLIGYHSTEESIYVTIGSDSMRINGSSVSQNVTLGNFSLSEGVARSYLRFPGNSLWVSDGSTTKCIDEASAFSAYVCQNCGILTATLRGPPTNQSIDSGWIFRNDSRLPFLIRLKPNCTVEDTGTTFRQVFSEFMQVVEYGVFPMDVTGRSKNCAMFAADDRINGFFGIEPSYGCDSFDLATSAFNLNTLQNPVTVVTDPSDGWVVKLSPPQVVSNPNVMSSSTIFDFVVNANIHGAHRPQTILRLTGSGSTWTSEFVNASRTVDQAPYGAAFGPDGLFIADLPAIGYQGLFHTAAAFPLRNVAPDIGFHQEAIYCGGRFFFVLQKYGYIFATADFQDYIQLSNITSSDYPQWKCIGDSYIVFRGLLGVSDTSLPALIAWQGDTTKSYVVLADIETDIGKFHIFAYNPELQVLIYGLLPVTVDPDFHTALLPLNATFPSNSTPIRFVIASNPLTGHFLTYTASCMLFLSASQNTIRRFDYALSEVLPSYNTRSPPFVIPTVGVLYYANHTDDLILLANDGSSRSVLNGQNPNYLIDTTFFASKNDQLLVSVQDMASGESKTLVTKLSTSSGPVDPAQVFEFSLVEAEPYDINGRLGFLCSTNATPIQLCYIDSDTLNSLVVYLSAYIAGDLHLNQPNTLYILPANGTVNGSVFIENSGTLQLSGSATVHGSVLLSSSTSAMIVGGAVVIQGSLASNGRIEIAPGSTLTVGANATILTGTLLFSAPLTSAVSAGCLTAGDGQIQVDLSSVTGQGEHLLLSGVSGCSSFGTSSVTFTNPSASVCASTEPRDSSSGSGGPQLTQLFLIYNQPGESGSCGAPSGEESNAGVIAGAVVGSVVGAALLVLAVLMLIPVTRQKILPYRSRSKTPLER